MVNFVFQGSIDEAKAQGLTIIDIRRPEEWLERKLPQADQEIEMNELAVNPEKYLQPEDKVLLVCKAGVRAIKTAEYLQDRGFSGVFAFPSAW